MSVVGADTWEAAPLLPSLEWSAPTPAAGLTQDAVDADPSWGIVRSCWWRFVVPDHDPTAPIRFVIEATSTIPEEDRVGGSPQLFIWTGDDPATRFDEDWTETQTELLFDAGTVLHLEAGQWSDVPEAERDSWTYRVAAGPLTFTYTPWTQGPNWSLPAVRQTMLQGEGYYGSADIETGVSGGADDYRGPINEILERIEGDLTFGVSGSPVTEIRNFGHEVKGEAQSLDWHLPTYSSYSFVRNLGMYMPSLDTLKQNFTQYRPNLSQDPNALPPGGEYYGGVEYEGGGGWDTFEVVDITFSLDYFGSGKVGTKLLARVYQRGATALTDGVEGVYGNLVDEHWWIGQDPFDDSASYPEARNITFTTTDVGPQGQMHLVARAELALPWEVSPPYATGNGSIVEAQTGLGVYLNLVDPADTSLGVQLPMVSGTVKPPRWRRKIAVFNPGATTRRRAHLRQYPRSPLRHWPPERSVQRSNRRAGGYK